VPRYRLKKDIQSENDFMRARASPSGFPIPYHFSFSLTCGFAFRHSARTCFHVVHARHLALNGLKKKDNTDNIVCCEFFLLAYHLKRESDRVDSPNKLRTPFTLLQKQRNF